MKYFVFLLFVLFPIVASADAVEINGIYYIINAERKTAEVTRNPSKYSGNLIIPESIIIDGKEYCVTSIGNGSFYDCKDLYSISIPNSITKIDDCAFYFSGITSIIIPNSVKEIGNMLFRGCKNMKSLIVDKDNIYYDSRNNCNAIISTKDNTIVQGCIVSTIPNSVTSIGDRAFLGCWIKSIEIPNSVVSIGKSAFWDCSITSLTIPSSVTSIGKEAFDYCGKLSTIIVDKNNVNYDSWNNCNAIIATKDNTLLYGCMNTTIPNTVTAINDHAFFCREGLTAITIPSSVKAIGNFAFWACI